MTYLEASGIFFNCLVFLCVVMLLWAFIILPMIEGVSMCRWYAAISREYPHVKPAKGWLHVWWSCTDIGGRGFTSTKNRYGEWRGIGNWSVRGKTNQGRHK